MQTWFAKGLIAALVGGLFLTTAPDASAVELKKYQDVLPGISFVLPADNVTIGFPTGDAAATSPLFLDGLKIATIGYNGRTAIITSFKMNIIARHTDWLAAFARAVGVTPANLQTVRNKEGLMFGVGNYIMPQNPDQPVAVAVAFAGDRGYFIQGQTVNASPMVNSVAAHMQIPGAPWGQLIPTKTIPVGDRKIVINQAYSATEIFKEDMKGAIITNGAPSEPSAIVITVKTALASSHADNRAVFEQELASSNLILRVTRDDPTETVFAAKSDTGADYTAMIASQETSSVSLLVPNAKTDVNAWMSGRHDYATLIDALRP